MELKEIIIRSQEIRKRILKDKALKNDISLELDQVPLPVQGKGEIKVIMIFQNAMIHYDHFVYKKMDISLDSLPGYWLEYMSDILKRLGYDLNNLYITYINKCFFKRDCSKDIRNVTKHADYWLELLKKEINKFPEAIILAMGEVSFKQFVKDQQRQIGYYWGNTAVSKSVTAGKFTHLTKENSRLNRDVFPLPFYSAYDQDPFYKQNLKKYLLWMGTKLNLKGVRMDAGQIVRKAEAIRNEIMTDKQSADDIDTKIKHIPEPFIGKEDIKVIVIAQDPTIRNKTDRERIKMVLNLNEPNSNYEYMENLMKGLGYKMDNLYATYFYKCFFKDSPADNPGLLQRHFRYWLDFAIEEISYHFDTILITLGESLPEQLITAGNKKLTLYWGEKEGSRKGGDFKVVESKNNVLGRNFYPFPNTRAYLQNKFYKRNFDKYVDWIREK